MSNINKLVLESYDLEQFINSVKGGSGGTIKDVVKNRIENLFNKPSGPTNPLAQKLYNDANLRQPIINFNTDHNNSYKDTVNTLVKPNTPTSPVNTNVRPTTNISQNMTPTTSYTSINTGNKIPFSGTVPKYTSGTVINPLLAGSAGALAGVAGVHMLNRQRR